MEARRHACGEPGPDRSGRSCDLPKGHAGEHGSYGGGRLTWAPVDPGYSVGPAPPPPRFHRSWSATPAALIPDREED